MNTLFLQLLVGFLSATEPQKVRFQARESLPVAVNLILPVRSGVFLEHEKTAHADEISTRLNPLGGSGLEVEITDKSGKRLWQRDFSDHDGGAPGPRVRLEAHPSLPVLIIHYEGYKWDHVHFLLFVDKTRKGFVVREYKNGDHDILPLLKRQPGFDSGYEYWIYPQNLENGGLVFNCIPLENPASHAAHPFAQALDWFDVKASVDGAFKITPRSATKSN